MRTLLRHGAKERYSKGASNTGTCCGALAWVPGLMYWSQEDPGHASSVYGIFSTDMLPTEFVPEDKDSFMLTDADTQYENNGSYHFHPETPFALPADYAATLGDHRGMFYPNAKCGLCRRGSGTAHFGIIKCKSSTGIETYPHKKYVEDAIALTRSHFPRASDVWPINAPCWRSLPDGGFNFTQKWMGQAFFVCSCRGQGLGRWSRQRVYWNGSPDLLYRKQLMYRCPDTTKGEEEEEEDEDPCALVLKDLCGGY